MSDSEQTPTPIKLALSVDKDFDPMYCTVKELTEKSAFVATRPECETDTTAVQLIPYITLVDVTEPALKYFVYTRGKASGEQRLAGKCSVGLGGHVEGIEEGIPAGNNDIINSVCMAAVREVKEEIGLDIPFHVFANAMQKNYVRETVACQNELYFSEAKLLYNTTTPTDVVHLGISFVLEAKSSDIKDLELDVITRGRWMTYEEIEDAETGENPIDLEVWSKTVIARVNLRAIIAKKH